MSVFCLFFLLQLTVGLFVSISLYLSGPENRKGACLCFPQVHMVKQDFQCDGFQRDVGTWRELDCKYGIFMPGISNCIKDMGGLTIPYNV